MKKLMILAAFGLFMNISSSQTVEFFNSSSKKIGEISNSNTPNMKCGNCLAHFDRFGNKVGEVSPPGGYQEFTNLTGEVICKWTDDSRIFERSELRGYSKQNNDNIRDHRLYDKQGRQIGYTKIDKVERNQLFFYSMSGKLLMKVTTSSIYISIYDFYISLAYFFVFLNN